MNYISKRQKALKGLKFGDWQNNIDHAISTGVMHELSKPIIPSNETGDMENIT